MKKVIILFVFLAFFLCFRSAIAVAPVKIIWCHTEPNGNSQTLELPQQALEQAGHADAGGNPLHSGDHAGACESATNTPTPTEGDASTPTSTDTDTPTPTPIITGNSTQTNTSGPTAINAPGSSVTPTSLVSAQESIRRKQRGQVLGVNTFAKTGTFENNAVSSILLLGLVSLAVSIKRYAKENKD